MLKREPDAALVLQGAIGVVEVNIEVVAEVDCCDHGEGRREVCPIVPHITPATKVIEEEVLDEVAHKVADNQASHEADCPRNRRPVGLFNGGHAHVVLDRVRCEIEHLQVGPILSVFLVALLRHVVLNPVGHANHCHYSEQQDPLARGSLEDNREDELVKETPDEVEWEVALDVAGVVADLIVEYPHEMVKHVPSLTREDEGAKLLILSIDQNQAGCKQEQLYVAQAQQGVNWLASLLFFGLCFLLLFLFGPDLLNGWNFIKCFLAFRKILVHKLLRAFAKLLLSKACQHVFG